MESLPVLECIPNFRDIGALINKTTHQNLLKTGRLYRSARPDAATPDDRRSLLINYKIKTIVDLRTKSEMLDAENRYATSQHEKDTADVKRSSLVPSSADHEPEALRIPGINYVPVNLSGPAFERAMVWQLSWSNLFLVLIYMALGYRHDAIAILGKNVMAPLGLLGLGTNTLKYSQPEIKSMFQLLANPNSYPLLVHCTQGKDRTGLVVLLTLLLCDVPLSAAKHDYVLSAEELKADEEVRIAEIKRIGVGAEFAQCAPNFCEGINKFLLSNYGGVKPYLESIGVDAQMQDSVRKNVLA